MDVGMNILIADDSMAMRKIIRKALQKIEAARILEAGNGREALSLSEKNEIDLFVTDWVMPIMDGVEFVRTIRGKAQYATKPILMVTSEAQQHNIHLASEAGVTDYITKPFSSDILLEKIEGLLLTISGEKDTITQALKPINPSRETDGRPQTKQFVSFRIDTNLMGIDILHVREINRALDITPVQHAPEYVKGLVNLRGQTVTVFDLGVRLGLAARRITEQTHNIIFKKDSVGILVDDISDVVSVDMMEIESPPANLAGIDTAYVEGVIKLSQELLVIISSEKILMQKEN